MPDSMIFDLIAADAECAAAVGSERVELLTTWVQEDQLEAIPDAAKREAIAQIPRTVVGTGVFLVGQGRIGIDRIGPAEPFNTLRGDGRGHLLDALIGATAHLDGLYLVTHDHRLMKKATAVGIPTVNFAAFRKLVFETLAD